MIRELVGKLRTGVMLALLLAAGIISSTSYASPFGQGVFGADVPFGSATSLSILLSGDVAVALTPNDSTFDGTNSHSLTVTSTDVVGYRLYAYSPTSSDMVNGSETIPASSNTSAGSLATDSWGYNTTGSTSDFLGMTTTPNVIKDANGPYKNGDATTVTYGVKASATKAAGDYAVSVVYTAVAKSQ